MSLIHPTAIIDPAAEIDSSVAIGPYSVIGPHVRIAANVVIKSHVVIEGHTQIGEGCEIYPFAALGQPPQHLRYEGEASELIIGKNNIIREHVTMHPGTAVDKMKTVIGNNGLFMVASHVAHDCVVGDNLILAQNAALGGHVVVEDNVYFGAYSAAHPFVRIGHNAVIGGVSAVVADVIPFGAVYGERGMLNGVNVVGMKRRGLDKQTMRAVKKAYDDLFLADGVLKDNLAKLKTEQGHIKEIADIIDFIEKESGRPLCLPKLS